MARRTAPGYIEVNRQDPPFKSTENPLFQPSLEPSRLRLITPFETPNADFYLHHGDHGNEQIRFVLTSHPRQNALVRLRFVELADHVGVQEVNQNSTGRSSK